MAVPRITSRRRQPTTRGGGLISQKLPGGGLFGPAPKKFAPAPAAPVSSVGSSAASIGGGVPAPAAPDPRDAQYFNDIAKLEQYYATRKADLQAGTDQDVRDLATSNQALNEQRPKDDLSAKQNANKAGLFYSGFLGKNLGEIETSYAKRRADLQTKFQDNANARARQSADLEANYGATGLNRNDILLAANARQTERDLANPPADPVPLSTPASVGAGNYALIAARQKKFARRPLQPWGR
jgi:hypothetical protein